MSNYENIDLQLLKDHKSSFKNIVTYVDLADALTKAKNIEGIDKDLLPFVENINICGISDNYNVGIFIDEEPVILFLKENDEGAYKNFVNIVKIKSEKVNNDDCVIV